MKNELVRVIILRGRNLVPQDSNGFSDPYVKVRLGRQTRKTSVAEKTLNPMWPSTSLLFLRCFVGDSKGDNAASSRSKSDEDVDEFDDYQDDDNDNENNNNDDDDDDEKPDARVPMSLNVTLYDFDRVGKDDPMGRFRVSLRRVKMGSAAGVQRWFKVEAPKGKSGSAKYRDCGELLLRVERLYDGTRAGQMLEFRPIRLVSENLPLQAPRLRVAVGRHQIESVVGRPMTKKMVLEAHAPNALATAASQASAPAVSAPPPPPPPFAKLAAEAGGRPALQISELGLPSRSHFEWQRGDKVSMRLGKSARTRDAVVSLLNASGTKVLASALLSLASIGTCANGECTVTLAIDESLRGHMATSALDAGIELRARIAIPTFVARASSETLTSDKMVVRVLIPGGEPFDTLSVADTVKTVLATPTTTVGELARQVLRRLGRIGRGNAIDSAATATLFELVWRDGAAESAVEHRANVFALLKRGGAERQLSLRYVGTDDDLAMLGIDSVRQQQQQQQQVKPKKSAASQRSSGDGDAFDFSEAGDQKRLGAFAVVYKVLSMFGWHPVVGIFVAMSIAFICGLYNLSALFPCFCAPLIYIFFRADLDVYVRRRARAMVALERQKMAVLSDAESCSWLNTCIDAVWDVDGVAIAHLIQGNVNNALASLDLAPFLHSLELTDVDLGSRFVRFSDVRSHRAPGTDILNLSAIVTIDSDSVFKIIAKLRGSHKKVGIVLKRFFFQAQVLFTLVLSRKRHRHVAHVRVQIVGADPSVFLTIEPAHVKFGIYELTGICSAVRTVVKNAIVQRLVAPNSIDVRLDDELTDDVSIESMLRDAERARHEALKRLNESRVDNAQRDESKSKEKVAKTKSKASSSSQSQLDVKHVDSALRADSTGKSAVKPSKSKPSKPPALVEPNKPTTAEKKPENMKRRLSMVLKGKTKQ
jgi:C2 domain